MPYLPRVLSCRHNSHPCFDVRRTGKADPSRWMPWHLRNGQRSSRQVRAPTDLYLTADHPVAALLGEVLSMRHLLLLKSTGEQGVAVLIGYVCKLLAGHADPRTLALPQTLNELLVLVPHCT